jgi:DNA-binding transcriptional LysR family regulator
VGIVSPPPAELGLAFEPLFVEPMALLVPEEHPLATAATLGPGDLARHRLLLTEQGCAYRDTIERALLAPGPAGRPGAAPRRPAGPGAGGAA